MKTLVALVLLVWPFLSAADTQDPVKPVSTATPQQQLVGDLFQILNANYLGGISAFGQPTNVLSQTNAGVWGTDQGVCTLFPDNRIFCIFGDTITTFWDAGRGQWNDYQFLNVCPGNGGISGGDKGCLGLKAMSLIPSVGGNPADPSGCNAIPGVDSALSAGSTPAIGYSGCWTPVYITNSSHQAGSQPAMASQTVNGLTTDADGIDEVILAAHTPGTAFVVDSNLYIEWNVTRKGIAAVGGGGYQMEGILMKCGPTNAITTVLSQELACSKSYVWSQAPTVIEGKAQVTTGSDHVTATSGEFVSYMTTSAGGGTGAYQLIWVDTDNQQEYAITGFTDVTHITISPAYSGASGKVDWNVMQHQETNIGKFVDSTTSVFTVAELPWAPHLPPALQSASTIVCTFGSSWAWRQSNLYLMCMDGAQIDTATYSYDPARVNGSGGGIQQAYYLTGLSADGIPSWTQAAENLAVPLLTTWNHTVLSEFLNPDPNGEVSFNIGKPSVRYSPGLQRFVLSYGSAETQGLQIRTSLTPWGPWSMEGTLLPNGHTLSTGSWESKMTSPKIGGYRFNLTLPNNAPVACSGCTNGVATNVMYDATNPAMQVGASDFPQLDAGGDWYGPYQYPVEHNFNNGIVGLYFHTSAFNPYAPLDFSVMMIQSAPFGLSSSPPSLTISSAGGNASATLTATAAAGFNGTVSLSCSVAYNGPGVANDPPTCSFNPAQLSLSSPNSGNTTVSIGSTARGMAMSRRRQGNWKWALFGPTGGSIVAGIFAGFSRRTGPSRKTPLRRLGLGVFLMVICGTLLLVPACGGGGSSGTNNSGTTAGSYTVTLNANSGIYATTISIPLTVQ